MNKHQNNCVKNEGIFRASIPGKWEDKKSFSRDKAEGSEAISRKQTNKHNQKTQWEFRIVPIARERRRRRKRAWRKGGGDEEGGGGIGKEKIGERERREGRKKKGRQAEMIC